MEKETLQSAWNLSQHIINQIGYLLQSASVKFRSGQIQNAYWDTEEIRTLIYADLNEDENKKLDEWELIIRKYHSIHKKYQDAMQKTELTSEQITIMKNAKQNHYKEVKKYRMYIMILLSKYGYSVSKKESAARMF